MGEKVRYWIFICDKLALPGDFKPKFAEHPRNLDLTESLAIGIDRIQRQWETPARADGFHEETKSSPSRPHREVFSFQMS